MLKKFQNAVPKDEYGNPLYKYTKIPNWIDGKLNYIYIIWGHPLYMPTQIEGKDVPIASKFFSWFTGNVWIMRNDGWHQLQDNEPLIHALDTPVDTLVAGEVNFALTDTGETEERMIGGEVYNIPIYTAVNESTIYDTEASAITLNLGYLSTLSSYNFKLKKDGQDSETEFEADLHNVVNLYVEQDGIATGQEFLEYGAIIRIEAEITPDPLPTFTINDGGETHDYEHEAGMTFEQFVDSEYNPEGDWNLAIGVDDVVFLGQTKPIKDELNNVQRKSDTIVANKTYYATSAPMFAFKVNADSTDYDFGFPSAAEVSTFADFITSPYNPVAEGEAYIEQDGGHVILMVNETSKQYHVQDNGEDVSATDDIVENKTYDGVEETNKKKRGK